MTLSRLTRFLAVALAVGATGTAGAQQQNRQFELGMDAALRIGSGGSAFVLPMQAIRFGVGLTPSISLEPTLGLTSGSGRTLITFDLGLPVDISHSAGGTEAFLRPLAGLVHESYRGSSVTQKTLGLGIGLRVPIVSQLMTRLEARDRVYFSTDGFGGGNEVELLAGISLMLP